MVVANQAAGQQVRFDENLEAVADAQDGHPAVGRIDDFGHDRRARRDGAAAQVVAIAKAAGEHDRVDPHEVMRAVPEGHGLGACKAHRALGVTIIERAREGDDADAH